MSKQNNTQAEVVTTAVASNKAEIARGVFASAYKQNPVPARKDIIASAVTAAGLTPKGAATYLQNFRKANGMVAAKA